MSKDITRIDPAIVAKLRALGAATVAGTLAGLGIRQPHIQGPVSWNKGKAIAGPALTLLMMPKREDLYGDGEYNDPQSAEFGDNRRVDAGDVFAHFNPFTSWSRTHHRVSDVGLPRT